MNGREIPSIGPDDESDERATSRMVFDSIHARPDAEDLEDLLVTLTGDELARDHPAAEMLGTILESVQARMAYFKVKDADRITIDQIQNLEPEYFLDPLMLEDLVLIVKDELHKEDADKPVPTILTFEHIIDASSRIDINKRLVDETKEAITMLAIRLFGQAQEKNLFRKAIESPANARKIRRFAWILNQPFMGVFPDTVRRELALRQYEKRIAGDSSPVGIKFSEVLLIANRTLRGMRVEIEHELLNIEPTDHDGIINNRMLSVDIERAIAVSETVANIDA
jgi:hypothetical protein